MDDRAIWDTLTVRDALDRGTTAQSCARSAHNLTPAELAARSNYLAFTVS
ncbi:hypothetical protein OG225_41690 (plasmid) [Nocardia sp. NBC_01377]